MQFARLCLIRSLKTLLTLQSPDTNIIHLKELRIYVNELFGRIMFEEILPAKRHLRQQPAK